jgi:hypothetical protein
LRGGRSAYPLVVGTIRSALAQEREMGGSAPPEEGSDGLTLIGSLPEGASWCNYSFANCASVLGSDSEALEQDPASL